MKQMMVLLAVTLLVVASISGCSKSPVQQNDAAPNFTLKSLDGQTVTLNALRGRPVLLNFWATWCGPCRYEMPFLQEIYLDPVWRDRGLVILAINLKETESVVEKFMTENGLSFPVLLDTRGEVADLYNIASIPTTFIIGKGGIIRNSRIGAFLSKDQIDDMLRASIPD